MLCPQSHSDRATGPVFTYRRNECSEIPSSGPGLQLRALLCDPALNMSLSLQHISTSMDQRCTRHLAIKEWMQSGPTTGKPRSYTIELRHTECQRTQRKTTSPVLGDRKDFPEEMTSKLRSEGWVKVGQAQKQKKCSMKKVSSAKVWREEMGSF